MSQTIYKPNKGNTGALVSFNLGPDKKGGDIKGELAVYINIVKQASWDGKKGSFKENAKNPEKNINLKINEFEVGGFLNAIRRRVEFKGFHTSGESTSVQFSFTPQDKDGKVVGFYLSVLRNGKDKFSVPITIAECEVLASWFDFGLKTLFSNRFRADVNRFAGYQEQRPQQQAVEPEPEPEVEQPAPQDDFSVGPTSEETSEDSTENPFG